jgi:hypothetical protein
MIIGVIGKKTSGKTTFTNEICQHLSSFEEIAFATPLKNICKELFSLSDEQIHDPFLKEEIDIRWNLSPRQLFQNIGTELFRNCYDRDIWIKIAREKMRTIKPSKNIIFSDIRQENELNFVRSLGNSETVIIVEIQRDVSSKKLDHHDTENFNLQCPEKIVFTNNGSLEDFKSKIENELIVNIKN